MYSITYSCLDGHEIPFCLENSSGKNSLEEMRMPQHRATQLFETADTLLGLDASHVGMEINPYSFFLIFSKFNYDICDLCYFENIHQNATPFTWTYVLSLAVAGMPEES